MADLDINLRVKDASARGVNSANSRINKLGGSLDGATKRSSGLGKTLGLLGGAAILGGIAKLTSGFLGQADALDKSSQKLGVGVEDLQRFAFAAEQAGSSGETFEKAILKQSRTLADASEGSAAAVDALAALGLEYSDLEGLSPEEAFLKLSDGIAGIEDPTLRAAAAQEVFGRSGGELLPLLNSGSEGITALTSSLSDNAVISTDAATSAAAFNDTLNKAKTEVQGLAQQGLAKILPVLSTFLGFLTSGSPAAKAIGIAIGAITVAMIAFKVAQLASNAAMLANPAVAIGVALVALGVIIYKYRDEILAAFITAWETARNVVTNAMGIIRYQVENVLDKVTGAFSTAFTKVGDVAKNGVNALIGIINAIPRAYISALNTIINGLNRVQIKIPDFVPGIGGKTLGVNIPNIPPVPEIPMLAQGGIVTSPTLAVIGERGPEAVIPLGRMGRTQQLNLYIDGGLVASMLLPHMNQQVASGDLDVTLA